MKVCTKCGVEKDLNEFYNDPRYAGGKFSQCKTCRTAYQRAHRKKNPDCQRKAWLKWKYKLPWDEYQSLLEKQRGVCAVCLSPPGDRLLNVDHCHDTGRVRGLLCGACNRAFGLLKEDTLRIMNLAAYSERHAN